MGDVEKPLTSGEAGKRVGLNPKTIRFYEHLGLIEPPRRTGGKYRQFGQREVQQLRFIREARNLGMPLKTISILVRSSTSCRGMRPKLRRTLEEEIRNLELQIGRLRSLKSDLQRRHRALARQPYSDHGEGCHCLDPLTIQFAPPKGLVARKGGAQ